MPKTISLDSNLDQLSNVTTIYALFLLRAEALQKDLKVCDVLGQHDDSEKRFESIFREARKKVIIYRLANKVVSR